MENVRFEDTSFSGWQQKLLRRKGDNLQRHFLQQLQDSSKFCQYMEKEIKKQSGDGRPPPLLDRKLTEVNYVDPSVNIEKWIFNQWKDIAPAEACNSAFWGWLSVRHIQCGIIESHFLAASRRNYSGGKERIIHAMEGEDKKEIDDIIRISLRRLCGLKKERGNRSIYSDCVFSRAWWRNYLCREVCKETKAEPSEVINLFRQSTTYWEKLITFVVSRNSVLGDVKVRNALVWALSKYVGRGESEYLSILGENGLDKIVQLISMRSAWQELGIFTMDELKDMMEKEFIARVI